MPLHPEAAAFAEHYGFVIDVLAAYRPTGKGRVEPMVAITRDHVIAGRVFDSIADLDGAWQTRIPIRRAQVHRTHGQVIGIRAGTGGRAGQTPPGALFNLGGVGVSVRLTSEAPGRSGDYHIAYSARSFVMLVYPAALDVSSTQLQLLTDLLVAHRTAIGSAWRRLSPTRQALLVLVYLRKNETYTALAAGFRIGVATVFRYIREGLAVLAEHAPTLEDAR